MELFSVHGLHKRGLYEIVDDIVEAGFNCVRMPYSLDLTFKSNFVVPDVALTANPELKGKTGLEIFHLTMKAMTDKNLMVFLNNHNSVAAWCCNADSEDGIWSNDAYSAEDWIVSLVYLADYYKDNKYVIGMDLRNEIHDVKKKGRFITWGESNDIDNDWKYATEVASRRIYEVNPDWLIIVSGLCFSFDLRSMVDNLPSIPQDRKLVWTVHYYSFSRWWTRYGDRLSESFGWDVGNKEAWRRVSKKSKEWMVIVGVAFGAVVGIVGAKMFMGFGKRVALVPRKNSVMWSGWGLTFFLWCVVAAVGLQVGAKSIREGYDNAGCAIMAVEADAMDAGRMGGSVLGAIGFVVGVGCFFARDLGEWKIRGKSFEKDKEKGIEMKELEAGEDNDRERLSSAENSDVEAAAAVEKTTGDLCDLAVYFFVLNLVVTLVISFICLLIASSLADKTSTYSMLHDELKSKWVIDGTAPVLVGEFGSGTDGLGGGEDWWNQMMRFLKQYDLDYAYWPWNGEKWDNSTYEYQNEGYGLVTVDWDEIRYPQKLADLMALG